MKQSKLKAGVLVLMAGCIHAASAAPLPGGASSLTETYEDWTINCQSQKEDATSCVISQMQSSSQTGQRVLTVELRNVADGKAEGVLVMPFGLDLSKGATLKIDDADGSTINFSTCLPQGCLVPLSFDEEQLGNLKTAANLNIDTVALSPSQPVPFKISLKGFANALNRIGALTQ